MIPLLLLCVAFQGQEPSVRESPPLGRQTGPFRFSISADRPIYQLGDPIFVTSVLRNETDHDLSIFMSSPLQFYGKNVMLPEPAWLPVRNLAVLTDEGQRQVFPGHMSASSRVIRPGGEIESKFELNKLYAMSVPGDYHIVFHFRAPDYVGKNVIVMSNEIVVTVAKAAP